MTDDLMPEILETLRHFSAALDMSDPDTDAYTESCADVVEFLWAGPIGVRGLIKRIEEREYIAVPVAVRTPPGKGSDA